MPMDALQALRLRQLEEEEELERKRRSAVTARLAAKAQRRKNKSRSSEQLQEEAERRRLRAAREAGVKEAMVEAVAPNKLEHTKVEEIRGGHDDSVRAAVVVPAHPRDEAWLLEHGNYHQREQRRQQGQSSGAAAAAVTTTEASRSGSRDAPLIPPIAAAEQFLVTAGRDCLAILWTRTSSRALKQQRQQQQRRQRQPQHPSSEAGQAGARELGQGRLSTTGATRSHTLPRWHRRRHFAHSGWVEAVALSVDARLLCSVECRTRDVLVWDVSSGSRVATLQGHSGNITSIGFAPVDDNDIVGVPSSSSTGGGDKGHRGVTQTPKRGTGYLPDIGDSNKGTSWPCPYHLASASLDGTCCVWRLSGGAGGNVELRRLNHDKAGVLCLAFARQPFPASRHQADGPPSKATTSTSTRARQRSQATGDGEDEDTHGDAASIHLLATGCTTGDVFLWDWQRGLKLHVLMGGHFSNTCASGLCFSPDSTLLASTSHLEGSLCVWDVYPFATSPQLHELVARQHAANGGSEVRTTREAALARFVVEDGPMAGTDLLRSPYREMLQRPRLQIEAPVPPSALDNAAFLHNAGLLEAKENWTDSDEQAASGAPSAKEAGKGREAAGQGLEADPAVDINNAWPLLHRLRCRKHFSCAPFFVPNPVWVGDDLRNRDPDPLFEYRWMVGCSAPRPERGDSDPAGAPSNAGSTVAERPRDSDSTVGEIVVYRLKSGTVAHMIPARSSPVRGFVAFGGIRRKDCTPKLPLGMKPLVSRPGTSASRPGTGVSRPGTGASRSGTSTSNDNAATAWHARRTGGGSGTSGTTGGGGGGRDEHVVLLTFSDAASEYDDGELCAGQNLAEWSLSRSPEAIETLFQRHKEFLKKQAEAR
eukprot:INCI3300.1.p1 GENE.INCI3300.1~~INCI3300.1.p1  ORF type:complete len:876 (+),score=153.37 INCI3300.1:260-2887(+)